MKNKEPVLDAPACVGAGTYQTGVKWSTVIKAAQRLYARACKDKPSTTPNLKEIREALSLAAMDIPQGYVLLPIELDDQTAQNVAQEKIQKAADLFMREWRDLPDSEIEILIQRHRANLIQKAKEEHSAVVRAYQKDNTE